MSILRTAAVACLMLLATSMVYGQDQLPGPWLRAHPI